MAAPRDGFARTLAGTALLAGAYFVAGKVGLWLGSGHANVSPVWPPTGIALAALVLGGARLWPGVALGALLVNATTDAPFGSACGIAIGNTLEAVLGAWLLARAGFRRDLCRMRDVLALLALGALLSTIASATLGVASLALGGAARWTEFPGLWWPWWLGDAKGALVVAPLLFVWADLRGAFRRRGAEAAALLAAMLLVGHLIFGGVTGLRLVESPEWVFPLLVWAAVRFGPPGAACASFAVSSLAIAYTRAGSGPFATGSTTESLIRVQAFMGVASVTSLLLAAATAERRRAEEDLRLANEDLGRRVRERTASLEEANRELEAFTDSVSHDLRAPLRHVEGFLDLLDPHAARTLDEKGRHYLELIRRSSLHMQALIDDLLALSRAGRTEMRQSSVDLDRLLREVLEEAKPDLAGREIEWSLAPLPPVRGDAPLLRQVLANLVSNAVKYTRKRERARIEVGSASGAEGEVVVFVRDNGVGFDPEHSGRLFGVFQRLHPRGEFEGTGIGLATVRRIVHRHGGRTWAEGRVDAGATFYFALPRGAARAQDGGTPHA